MIILCAIPELQIYITQVDTLVPIDQQAISFKQWMTKPQYVT